MTVKELAEKVKTPEQLSFWMGRNIWYHYDKDKWGKEDYWQTPEETLSKENKYKEYSGDCEDFAILVRDVLKEWKINSTIIILTKINTGHDIC
jgi:predicted transglutaminase-like cysteine proteinase